MRAAALLIALAMLLPGSFVAPQIGMLAWCWMSFASPQQYAYFTTLPLVYIVALVTAIGWVCSPEPKRIPFNATTIFIIAFMACMTLSTMLSLDPSLSWKAWDRNIKNVLIALAIMALMRSRVRIHALVWVIVLSLGMYSIKGGLFTIVTGSVNHVVGLSGTMIADNNQIGLAMTIAWPLMYYLRQHSVNRWVRHGLVVMMVLTIAAVLGTYSRGAFLAFSIVLIYFFWKSRHKLTIAVCGAALLVPIVLYVPRGWVDRMQSIETYQEDSSALGRFASWQLAISIAKARPLIGGGLEIDPIAARHRALLPGQARARGAQRLVRDAGGYRLPWARAVRAHLAHRLVSVHFHPPRLALPAGSSVGAGSRHHGTAQPCRLRRRRQLPVDGLL